jgi:hypothetical protein
VVSIRPQAAYSTNEIYRSSALCAAGDRELRVLADHIALSNVIVITTGSPTLDDGTRYRWHTNLKP